MTHYTPLTFELGRYGTSSTRPPRCRACGQRAFVREEGGRCYTILEMEAAWRFMQRQRRWPEGMLAPPPEDS